MKKFLFVYVVTFLFYVTIYDFVNNEQLWWEVALGALGSVLFAYLIAQIIFRKKKTRGFEVVADEHRKHPDTVIQLPRRGDAGSCASDIYSPVALVLQPGEQQLIWTDIKAYMRESEVCIGNVRSSHGKPRVRLANTQGWIDQTYYSNEGNDGNIGIFLSNEGNEPFEINVGDRIAQLMFIPYLVPDNDNPIHNKRKGGFGSSGK